MESSQCRGRWSLREDREANDGGPARVKRVVQWPRLAQKGRPRKELTPAVPDTLLLRHREGQKSVLMQGSR